MSKRPSFNSMSTLARPFMKREMSKRDRWVDHDDYEEYYDEDSAWGPPPRKYTCHICVVDVPCEDTLRKHKLGKDHMKREKDLEACFLIQIGKKFEICRRRGRGKTLSTKPGQSPRSQGGTMGDMRQVLLDVLNY